MEVMIDVQVEGGLLRGSRLPDGLAEFRGVPYAAPPVGDLRFQWPEPASPWDGVREALDFGDECLHASTTATAEEKPRMQSEDCLTLNIWSPAGFPSTRDLLPVMVFIHGGAFREGSSASPLYEAADLARAGGLVTVTLNYRLGAFGFLVSIEDGLYGNLGLWDQQLALKWVQHNIAQFGGDANQVTLFGESAGAMSTAVHLMLPSSDKLFRRAILQSNPASYQYRSTALADKLGQAFKRMFQCPTVRCLQDEPAGALLEASSALINLPRSSTDFIFWSPSYGAGSGVPHTPRIWAQLHHSSSKLSPKEVMLGTNEHEGQFFVALAFAMKMPYFAYLTTIGYMFKLKAMKVLAHYAPLAQLARKSTQLGGSGGDHRNPFSGLLTDYMFRCAARNSSAHWYDHAAGLQYKIPSRRRSAGVPLYLFHFTQRSNHATGLPECDGLACHMAELPFVFNRTVSGPPANGTFSADEQQLTELTMAYWTAFAREGDPNHKVPARDAPIMRSRAARERPHWGTWSPQVPAQMHLKWPPGLEGSACDASCDFWDELGYSF